MEGESFSNKSDGHKNYQFEESDEKGNSPVHASIEKVGGLHLDFVVEKNESVMSTWVTMWITVCY